MYEISCQMCMDLMPLVHDGVASEDSRKAVEHHIQTCDACRALYEGDTLPDGNADKALTKAMKRVQTVSMVFFVLFVLLGVCLCEMVMQGSSMIFFLVVLGIRGLLRIAFRKGEGGVHNIKKMAALLLAAALIVGIGWVGNEVFGNPVSEHLAEKAAQQYLEDNFKDPELFIEDVSYASSSSTYRVEVRSDTSMDTYFEIVYRDGTFLYDTYEERVLNRGNTADRLDRAYRELTDSVLNPLANTYSVHIAYGTIECDAETLELDGQYDLKELGAQSGYLHITIRDDVVSEERAGEILLDIKERMDTAGICFSAIDFSLWYPRASDDPELWSAGSDEERTEIKVIGFRYEDIREEGLTDRVREANEEAAAYYAARNAERQEQ